MGRHFSFGCVTFWSVFSSHVTGVNPSWRNSVIIGNDLKAAWHTGFQAETQAGRGSAPFGPDPICKTTQGGEFWQPEPQSRS